MVTVLINPGNKPQEAHDLPRHRQFLPLFIFVN